MITHPDTPYHRALAAQAAWDSLLRAPAAVFAAAEKAGWVAELDSANDEACLAYFFSCCEVDA